MLINLSLPIPLIVLLAGLAAAFLLAGIFMNRRDGLRDRSSAGSSSDQGVDAGLLSSGRASGKGSRQCFSPCDPLPNGYQRQDYYAYGINDADIEYWGLDQPGAPEPFAAGIAIADITDDKEMGKLLQ